MQHKTIYLEYASFYASGGGGEVHQVSSDGDDRMGAKNKTQTNPWIQCNALNIKTTSLVVHYSLGHAAGIGGHYQECSDCFEYPKTKKSLL